MQQAETKGTVTLAAMVTRLHYELRSQQIRGAAEVIGRFWAALARPFRRTPQPPPRYAVVMTTQCRDQLTEKLRGSVRRGHEGIVYFVGLTTGSTSLALSAMAPEADATAGSVDVSAV